MHAETGVVNSAIATLGNWREQSLAAKREKRVQHSFSEASSNHVEHANDGTLLIQQVSILAPGLLHRVERQLRLRRIAGPIRLLPLVSLIIFDTMTGPRAESVVEKGRRHYDYDVEKRGKGSRTCRTSAYSWELQTQHSPPMQPAKAAGCRVAPRRGDR